MDWAARIHRFRFAIFYLSGAAAVLLFIAGVFMDFPMAPLLVFGLLFALAILLDFKWLFFLLLLALPVSNEIALGDSLSLYIPTEPLAMLLMGVYLLYILLHPHELKHAFWKHPLTLILLVHLAWIGVSSIASTHPMVSLKYFAAKLWFIVPYYFLAGLLVRDRLTFRKVFWLLFIPTFAGMIYVLVRHGLTGFSFDEVNSVVRPIFRNHVNYGVWITAMLPLILLARTWYRPDRLTRLILDTGLVVTLVSIYFSYTRGAWVALICLPLYFGIIRLRLVRPAFLAATVGALIFIGMMFRDNTYLTYAPDYNKTISHEELGDHMSATFQMQDMSTVERFYRWIAAYRMADERPLTGFGPGNFVNNYKQYTVTAYATYISDNKEGSSVHNYFLTMLTEQGIPGLVIFIVLIAFILVRFEKVYHQVRGPDDRRLVMAVSCCFLVLLINNIFSDLLEADKLGPLFYMCMALLVNLDTGNLQADRSPDDEAFSG